VSEQPTLPEILPDQAQRRGLLEAIVYVAEEPLTLEQIAAGLQLPQEVVKTDLDAMISEYARQSRGIEIRAIAGGYKMSTKAEHHEGVRGFVRTLRPKLKLSLPALETVAVIAYKQPITVPEIQAIRGVNVTGVIHTLLNRKLITTAGRKKVIGKPMLYRTTKEFLIQFGLEGLAELPSLKEFEELSRGILDEGEEDASSEEQAATEETAPSEGAESAESKTPGEDESAPSESAAGVESEAAGTDEPMPVEEAAAAESASPGEDGSAGEAALKEESESTDETEDSQAENGHLEKEPNHDQANDGQANDNQTNDDQAND